MMRIIRFIISSVMLVLVSLPSLAAEKMTIEWAPFTVKTGVSDERLLQAAQNVEDGFLKNQDGYIRRSLLKGDGDNWVDIVYWKSEEDANRASAVANESPVCFEYFTLMQAAEHSQVSSVQHFQVIKSWY